MFFIFPHTPDFSHLDCQLSKIGESLPDAFRHAHQKESLVSTRERKVLLTPQEIIFFCTMKERGGLYAEKLSTQS